MSKAGKNLDGQMVDGKFPLLRKLGSSEHSVVFITEQKMQPTTAVIKLLPVTACDPELQLSLWAAAAQFSHPNLIRLFEAGRCRLGDEDYCYVVMEYAEENLYQILPERPLSPEEARQMLPSVFEALGYLHGLGFAHGQVRPSNVLATGDQIKLSTDAVVRLGQVSNLPARRSLYDPPEGAKVPVSPATDMWALGVTLVEALTQHAPAWKDGPEGEYLLPQSLPEPYSEIVRNCLRRDPEQRWSLSQVNASLASPRRTGPAATPARGPKPESIELKKPIFTKPGVLAGTSIAVLVLLVLFFVRILHHGEAGEPASSSVTAPTAQPSTNLSPVPAPPPSTPEASPKPTPFAPTVPVNSHGVVLQKVMPDVPRSARSTIQGTIRVSVRVNVNSSGDVISTSLATPGPSTYFAKLASQSAQKWKFAAAQRNGQAVPTTWIIKFEFRHDGTRAAANPA